MMFTRSLWDIVAKPADGKVLKKARSRPPGFANTNIMSATTKGIEQGVEYTEAPASSEL